MWLESMKNEKKKSAVNGYFLLFCGLLKETDIECWSKNAVMMMMISVLCKKKKVMMFLLLSVLVVRTQVQA